MDIQTVIVAAVLVAAFGVVLVKIKKALRGGGCSCGCSSCSAKSGCGSKPSRFRELRADAK